ncbi:hypothetical protein [Pediococcus claussenii]|uniref:Uncharacterized protein n=1 Tax=Pediococcus claussenii (strain ATCC BAA-344 / DSM 14800 / JCM 18046 / KCTC 3811 / LMG 21948 / P06) TaxID=701521 RepID=G8PEG2_PEDCP|nr:hypothetical protein [Pediococcus claussenii]AEV95571.1 hypothetical protein PECL_1345 [Pediococcus claussenii ATCC BAA-344]ANZ69092.1 hypothetical protein AYR57_01710 [Pediococcus claussenii]ANZ70909.1 hypothetical protein AYR58_01710 [Pediococcus claussenii]KRN20195.1 hypothetical protein IV79_GL000862 [Pediococcus claussenii]
MAIELNVIIDGQTIKAMTKNLTISIGEKVEGAIFLVTKNRKLLEVTETMPNLLESETVVAIQDKKQLEKKYLIRGIIEKAKESRVKLRSYKEEGVIPANFVNLVNQEVTQIITILNSFGYELFSKKKVGAKASHRWSKEISEIPFFVDSYGSKATIYWKKRNEMLILSGAKLREDIPLNKDGSLGFAARLGEKLRADHESELKKLSTTVDITFKSVNEVGLFLYFGGTNGWLELKDKNNKTIDEYTIVK